MGFSMKRQEKDGRNADAFLCIKPGESLREGGRNALHFMIICWSMNVWRMDSLQVTFRNAGVKKGKFSQRFFKLGRGGMRKITL
ncbi:hypothetical protein ERICV_05194 (plasmid) [Paenibacillus larvae subsp. larvae]|uniref:Uncharacterized protein n=1 Tax=Paenibacillus larvae subsp. larvae TaxID=147375 RepID=A0A6C0R0D0_9BACL|nr:hypothetical protein ERICV_05194 [Paenibacillus larvae subsp. larvae]